MVHGHLDHHGPGVGHEAVGRLQADDAAPARRGCGSSRPGRRRWPCRYRLPRPRLRCRWTRHRSSGSSCAVADRAIGRGVAAAGERAVLAVGLAENGPAGIEHAGHHGGVDIRDIALERLGAVDHGKARDADRVLDADRPAGEHTAARAPDLALREPRVCRVLRGPRPVGACARILDRRLGLLHRVEAPVALDRPAIISA